MTSGAYLDCYYFAAITAVSKSGLSHFILIWCCCRSNIDQLCRLRIDQVIVS